VRLVLGYPDFYCIVSLDGILNLSGGSSRQKSGSGRNQRRRGQEKMEARLPNPRNGRTRFHALLFCVAEGEGPPDLGSLPRNLPK